jgi:flagellar motor switch protein FliG
MANLSGPHKAALFLMALGDKTSTLIMKSLSADEIKALGSCMVSIQEVKKEVAADLLREFNAKFFSEGDLHTAGKEFFRNLLPNVLDTDQAAELLGTMNKEREEQPFKNVRDLDAKLLAGFVKNEHPQTIAIILAHLDNSKAGQVLNFLPDDLQFEVLNRIAHLENVPPDLVHEVDRVLEAELLTVGRDSGQSRGGVQVAAEILNSCDRRAEENIMQAMEDHEPEMADKIRKLMFVFEDLVNVNDQGIRELLKEVRNEELTLALKTASDELKQKIFKNLSQRAAQMLEEDISIMGPVRLSEVEAVQQNIIAVARRLEREGKVVLMGGEGGDTFV